MFSSSSTKRIRFFFASEFVIFFVCLGEDGPHVWSVNIETMSSLSLERNEISIPGEQSLATALYQASVIYGGLLLMTDLLAMLWWSKNSRLTISSGFCRTYRHQ